MVALLLPYGASASSPAITEDAVQIKELNFVYLHGMGGTPCTLQRLSDWITKRLSDYIYLYEQANPGIKVKVNTLFRCYPGYLNIDTWANNLVESIDEHFKGKDNLILIGHSMGGKTALYAVAKNIGGLADKVSTVITINSPIKNLSEYYPPGGGPVLNYCITGLLGSDEGVCIAVTNYDSSSDGKWVAEYRHWLAFISAENAPLSPQFDRNGVDAWPMDMDDSIVPISAQYADGADVIYYGEYGHSTLGTSDTVAESIANQIVRYLFGFPVDCCVLSGNGAFKHSADWLIGKDQWDEVVGEVVATTGTLRYTNESFTQWKQWEETLGEIIPQAKRSSILVRQLSFPLLTNIKEARWVTADEPEDCRLYLRVSAAPRTTVEANWTIYRSPLLPEGTKRAYYEVNITDGTPLVAITHISWLNEDTRDLRLRVWSEAHSPFRWFTAKWRVYNYESRQKNIISEIPIVSSSGGS
ncbi:MAG: alpha/beta hydrolase [Dehalococcoidales bacterium]|nr:alpha/beta hydrolase [Dehalococcoidales bacterium]